MTLKFKEPPPTPYLSDEKCIYATVSRQVVTHSCIISDAESVLHISRGLGRVDREVMLRPRSRGS